MIKTWILDFWFRGYAVRTFAELASAFGRSRWHVGTGVGSLALYVELREAVKELLREGALVWTEDDRLTAVWSGM